MCEDQRWLVHRQACLPLPAAHATPPSAAAAEGQIGCWAAPSPAPPSTAGPAAPVSHHLQPVNSRKRHSLQKMQFVVPDQPFRFLTTWRGTSTVEKQKCEEKGSFEEFGTQQGASSIHSRAGRDARRARRAHSCADKPAWLAALATCPQRCGCRALRSHATITKSKSPERLPTRKASAPLPGCGGAAAKEQCCSCAGAAARMPAQYRSQ